MELTNVISFRATEDEAKAIETTLQNLGASRAEFVREAFLQGFKIATQVIAARKKAESVKRLELLGMVRDTGFEPVTPTVSTDGSRPKIKEGNPKKLPFYSPSQAPLLPPQIITIPTVGKKPAVGLLHGVVVQGNSQQLSGMPAAVGASERSL